MSLAAFAWHTTESWTRWITKSSAQGLIPLPPPVPSPCFFLFCTVLLHVVYSVHAFIHWVAVCTVCCVCVFPQCEKIRRKRAAFLGSIRVAHTSSIDDTDSKIMSTKWVHVCCGLTCVCFLHCNHRTLLLTILNRSLGLLAKVTLTSVGSPCWVLHLRCFTHWQKSSAIPSMVVKSVVAQLSSQCAFE
jgi:hypothetical protein